MKLTALALSTVLLCSTGAFAQTNAPATSPNGSATTNPQPANPNGGAMQNPNAAPNSTDDTGTMNNGYRHHGGGGWGWIGLFGLLGFFGLGGSRRNRNDIATTTTTPRARL
jgi:hypothetical protein